MKKTTVPTDVLAALSAASFEGKEMRLAGMLDRGVYTRVAKIVEAVGGKWNRKAAAHVFDGDAYEAIEPVLMTGEIMRPADLGQFDSPPAVVQRVMELADIQPGMIVLEPSAGTGNIVEAALAFSPKRVRAVDIDPKRTRKLDDRYGGPDAVVRRVCMDFLKADPASIEERYDRVVMNPPFAKQADIAHVLHAAKFLKPGGRLVSVMAAGITFRQDRRTADFMNWLRSLGGTVERLPDNSFKMSGTSVGTVVIAFDMPAVTA